MPKHLLLGHLQTETLCCCHLGEAFDEQLRKQNEETQDLGSLLEPSAGTLRGGAESQAS